MPFKLRHGDLVIEGDASNLRLTKVRFPTLSSHFFANYINIFHKTEVQTVILRCFVNLYLRRFSPEDNRHKYLSETVVLIQIGVLRRP